MRHAPVRPGPAGPCSDPQHRALGVSQTEPGEGRGNGSRPVPGGPGQVRPGPEINAHLYLPAVFYYARRAS
jgi:hypothetical protein